MEEECKFLAGVEHLDHDDMVELCWVGVPSTPEDFVNRAYKAGHPRGLDVHVDEAMRNVVRGKPFRPTVCLGQEEGPILEEVDCEGQRACSGGRTT